MIKAIILDCFGVLVGRGFDETYSTAGGDPQRDREFIDDMLAKTNRGLISQLEFDRGMARQLGLTGQQWREILDNVEKPNMELLDYIKSSYKNCKVAVLSNANRGLIEYIEAMVGKGYFDDIVVSAEIGLLKPDPEIYRIATERLGVKLDECVFIDDYEGHLVPAKALGMQTILYQDFAQTKRELMKLLALNRSEK